MKFAPVCPIHIYRALAEHSDATIGDYFLLLAHDVLKHPKEYNEFFKGWFTKKGLDRTVIMDNSVIELGDSCDAATLFEACEIVGATCVVMPDVLCDGKGTVEASKKFLTEWDKMKGHEQYQLMYVPQGSSIEDYTYSVERVAMMPEMLSRIDWIGIARNLTKRIFPTRKIAVGYCHARLGEWARIHMLGFSADTTDDVLTCITMSHLISGIDSAVPLRLGTLDQNLGYPITDPGPRGDWWETVTITPQILTNVLEMRRRIERVGPWMYDSARGDLV